MLKHVKKSNDWNEKSLGARGFTLIELLVVIVILGVLAGVVVFSINGITDNSKKSACKANKSTVETAVEAYRAEKGSYPANINALVPDFIRSAPTGFTVSGATVSGPDCDNLP